MTDKPIQHMIEMYHRKAIRGPTKRLCAAIEQDPTSIAVRVRLREFALARGDLLTAAAYDAESFFDNPTIVAYDQLMADRIASIWPEEAIAIWERIIQNSTDARQGDYDNIVRALKYMKSILFILGRAKEFRARIHSMIESNKRGRNLADVLEEL